MMKRGGREESRGKCKSVAGGGRREESFSSPSLGFLNGAAPELCGSERVRVRQP